MATKAELLAENRFLKQILKSIVTKIYKSGLVIIDKRIDKSLL